MWILHDELEPSHYFVAVYLAVFEDELSIHPQNDDLTQLSVVQQSIAVCHDLVCHTEHTLTN